MPTAAEVQSANPAHLSNNTFLVNLAVTFHVVSIPLAIFILILVLIGCVLFLVAVFCIVRSCIHHKFVPKKKKKPYKAVYLDELPGIVTSEDEKYGSLEYALEYNMDRGELNVNVIQANHLSPRPGVESLDPYVSVSLFKEKQGGRTERIGKLYKTFRKKGEHPIWNQGFVFNLSESDLRLCTLLAEVLDYDSIGQDYSLGQLKVMLGELDEGEYVGKFMELTGWLGPGEPMLEGIGEVCLGLSYYPQFGRIDITVLEARQLKLQDQLKGSKEYRVFFEIKLKDKNEKTLGSGATKALTELVNPYFNERLSFPLKNGKLEDCTISCRLRRHANMGSKKILGLVTLGTTSSLTTGVKHWEEMLKSPSKMHAMWHVLDPKIS